MFNLSGKVALVTGGNGGIGLGMAQGLADAGAAILVAGRNDEKNAAAVATLVESGSDAAAATADVTDEAAVAAMVEAALSRWGRLNILVNNAGINIRKEPQELS
ncbi:MAG TPA: SDR family NAD(P)-dependent oxidoreductase, partial [Alphaproteobacteria bacterium]|nr:SDR family NAD(P)-dependent oxidoreductase [Alphaproteobacteria bacterium]